MNFFKSTTEKVAEIEENRLSKEEAENFALLMTTKLSEYLDRGQFKKEEYDQALREIESLKRWADGNETTIENLKANLESMLDSKIIVGILATVGLEGFMHAAGLEKGHELLAAVMSAAGGMISATMIEDDRSKYTRKREAREELQGLGDQV